MKNRKSYSVTRLVSYFMLLLFGATILISVFYYTAFTKRAYQDNLRDMELDTEQKAEELSIRLALIQQQLSWVVSDVGSSTYWITNSPNEQLLYRQTAQNGLYGSIYNSDVIDAAFLSQRKDNVIISSHRMTEAGFLRFLRMYGPSQIVQPATPGLFSTDGSEGKPTHLIIAQNVEVMSSSTQMSQSVATVYFAIRLDGLLTTMMPNGIQAIYYGTGDQLQLCHSIGESDCPMPESISLTQMQTGEEMELDGKAHAAVLQKADFPGFYVVSMVEQQYLSNQMFYIVMLGIALVMVIFGLTIGGIYLTSSLIHQPVRNIVESMRRIQQGDYAYRLESTPAEELREISTGVNNVLDELEQRTQDKIAAQENLYRQQLLYQESRMQALQSQINPHFLYNTLECVRSIAQSHQVLEIQQIIGGMIRIFRYGASSNFMGTVDSELSICEDYLQIMHLRYGSRFAYWVETEESIRNVPIPRMTVQPLVENAINHGLADRFSGGEIRITCKSLGNELQICVRDNGKGIAPSKQEEFMQGAIVSRSGSIGLQNVRQRLSFQGGGLTVDSQLGCYTAMTIHLPDVHGEEAGYEK